MKKTLDWTSREVVNCFDEVTLWSAPFGRLLLESIPMKRGAKVVDIGFGTGFPLIELSQRFGDGSKVYGIDIWNEAIKRTKEKIKTLSINNIEIIKESASNIKIETNTIDLVTSNLGINNFEEKLLVYGEVQRILKSGGKLCLTTNPIGTFEELFELFHTVLQEMQLQEEIIKLENYVLHRGTEKEIISELEQYFKLVKTKSDTTNFRFVDAAAVMNHSLIRIGFRAAWENILKEKHKAAFFDRVVQKIDGFIKSEGEFKISIPMLYLEFEKR